MDRGDRDEQHAETIAYSMKYGDKQATNTRELAPESGSKLRNLAPWDTFFVLTSVG